MKLTRCDNHSDRDAVATFRIIEIAVGTRPVVIGYSTGAPYLIDLCQECADKVRAIKNKNGEN